MATFEEVQSLALQLSFDDRDTLLLRLLESLSTEPHDEWEYVETGSSWDQEIKKRLDDIDSGRETTMSDEEFKNSIQEEIDAIEEEFHAATA